MEKLNIDLAEWKALSKDRRHDLVIQWSRGDEWFLYENLASEAATALKRKLTSISVVTNVEVQGGDILQAGPPLVQELVLVVCALLPGSAKLELVPASYEGFDVWQLNLADKRESFLETWKRLFKELKGWGEAETLKWAEKWDDELTGRRCSAIYHYGPVKIALSSLVDEDIKKTVGKRLQLLYSDIRNVIENTETEQSVRIEHPDKMENYDWDHVRVKIMKLIESYCK